MKFRRFMRKAWSWLRCFVPAAVALVILWVCKRFPDMTETVFAKGIFRVVSTVLGTFTQHLPFSITEILVVVLLPLAAVAILWLLIRGIVCHKWLYWQRMIRAFCWIISYVFFFYVLTYGVYYYRTPIAERMNLSAETEISAEELSDFCRQMAIKASAARENCKTDENGCMVLSDTLETTLKSGALGYDALEKTYPFLDGIIRNTKGVGFSDKWSYTGMTGVYCPFLSEASINTAISDSELPLTIAHELAHARGYAHEDECNFLGILACVSHPNAAWQYSGWLSAYIYASNSLRAVNPDLCKEAYTYCSEGVLRDLKQRSAFWDMHSGKIMEATDRVNNAFIRANGDDEGTARYDLVTELLVRWNRSQA